jgi:hypothetical protein
MQQNDKMIVLHLSGKKIVLIGRRQYEISILPEKQIGLKLYNGYKQTEQNY